MPCRIEHKLGGFARGRLLCGFSLVELLMVLAVIGLLAVFTTPLISNINRGRDVTSSAYGLHDLMEYARSEAMARNTYTWVGFANLPSTHASNKTGSAQVVAAIFCSQDGTASANQSLIGVLAKPMKFKNVKIVSSGEIDSEVRDQLDAAVALSLTSQSTPKTLPSVGGITFRQSITFTPQGLAMLKAEPSLQDGFDEAIDIGVVQMAGDTEVASPNDACLRVSGASGTSHIYRLQ